MGKKMGDPIESREREARNRKPAIESIEREIVQVRKVLESIATGEETYNHLTNEQIAKLESQINQTTSWLHKNIDLQAKKAMHEDPILKTADVMEAHGVFHSECNPIVTTPKPAPPPPPPPEAEKQAKPQPNGTAN